MRKVNFDTLDKLTVPSALMEKALAIAKTPQTPDAAPARPRRTRLIAAASIALVLLAGFSAYFFFGNKAIPVRPSGTPTEPITAASTAHDETSSTEPTVPAATDRAAQETLAADPPATQLHTAEEPAGSRIETTPAAPTQPSAPAEPVTQAATEAATQGAEPPSESAPATEATPPTEDKAREPGPDVPGAPAVGRVICSYIYTNTLTGTGRIFCVLYDQAGNRIGENGLFSPAREAEIEEIGNDVVLFLYMPPTEWALEDDMYDMEIYNEDGVMIRKTAVCPDYQ